MLKLHRETLTAECHGNSMHLSRLESRICRMTLRLQRLQSYLETYFRKFFRGEFNRRSNKNSSRHFQLRIPRVRALWISGTGYLREASTGFHFIVIRVYRY